MPSTSAAWLTDNITGISSKFLYTLSPPFFAHGLAQIACKPFLVLVRWVTLFWSKLVNFCSQYCQNSLIFNHHTATLKWIRKSLDILRKTLLTAYEFHIIRKSITNRKADRLCRTAFSGISTPENHTPLSCLKIDGLKSASKSTQKSRDFIQNRVKNQFKKLKRKTTVFFKFRLLDYLSSARTVGYSKFDELCRYYFAVRFQKIFEWYLCSLFLRVTWACFCRWSDTYYTS